MKNMRLQSLDVFRGLTITLMIIVNSPGNQSPFSWLDHSAWNGCTLADLVFPFFIFILGISSVLALSRQEERGLSRRDMLIKIIWRSSYLFIIGLLLNSISTKVDWSNLRIFGVLQRIALCYGIGAWLYLTTSLRTQFILMMLILIGYCLAMNLISVPGYGAAQLTEEGNLAAWVDQWLIPASHRYFSGFDPEGIFTTTPAIASVLMGNLFGAWLLNESQLQHKTAVMFVMGLILAVAGWIWGIYFPINKSLWTSSYVLWTGGWAIILFALCYWLIEVKNYTRWSRPFELFGLNALTAFILHVVFLKLQAMIRIQVAPNEILNLRSYITRLLFPFSQLELASLSYALSYTLLWFLIICVINSKHGILRNLGYNNCLSFFNK